MQIPIDTFRLPNGLFVTLSEDHTAPLVAVNLWYHVGSANERAGRTGFAHLFEHMLFQGSANVAANEHFELVQRAGGTLNGSTWLDRTNYFETVPSNQLALALWLEADRMGRLLPAARCGEERESMVGGQPAVRHVVGKTAGAGVSSRPPVSPLAHRVDGRPVRGEPR